MATQSIIPAPSGVINVTIGAGGSGARPGTATTVTAPGTSTTVVAPGSGAVQVYQNKVGGVIPAPPTTAFGTLIIGQPAGVSATAKTQPQYVSSGTPGTVTIQWNPVVIPPGPPVEVPVTVATPVVTPVYAPTYTSIPGQPGGQGGYGAFSKSSIRVNAGDIITVSVGGPGNGSTGGFGYQFTSNATSYSNTEFTMTNENWIDPFTSLAGTSNDICVAIIDESSVSQSNINSSWNLFRTRWPTRKFYLLCPDIKYDEVELPVGFDSDPNAFGPFIVSRDNGDRTKTTDWFDLCDINTLVSGSSVRWAVDDSGSMFRKTPSNNIVCVKASRELFIQRLSGRVIISYEGGDGGGSGAGSGGGGGGATVVLLNGNVVAVAGGAGGGGAGGGSGGKPGTRGSSGVASGAGSGVQGKGQSAASGEPGGGGGGGGFYGGLAGATGSTNGDGGQGGTSLGSFAESGSTALPGGTFYTQYPGKNIGHPGFTGAAVIELIKSFNISIKDVTAWRTVDSAYVKIGGGWKELLNGWVKVSGVWRPLINNELEIEVPIAPVPTYALSRSASSITDGGSVTFTLVTTNIASGTDLAYTVTGIENGDIDGGTSDDLKGNFIVGTKNSVTYNIKSWGARKGAKTIKISLDNGRASTTCTIIDTYIPPTYALTRSASSINEGGSVTFTLNVGNAIPNEQIPWSISGVSPNDLSSGSMTGTFIVGSVESASFTLVEDYLTEGIENITLSLYGKGVSLSCDIQDTSTKPSGSQIYSTAGSGTWTVPAGVTFISVKIVGGGGGAGGSHSGCDHPSQHHGGEGGGGYVLSRTFDVVPGQTFGWIVGAGGAGGAAQKNGANGNRSVFGDFGADGGQGGDGNTKEKPTAGSGGPGGNGGKYVVRSGAAGLPGGDGRIEITW